MPCFEVINGCASIPETEQELLQRAASLQGKNLQYLATALGITLSAKLLQDKGLVGQMLERYLGANAGNQARPDFPALGIELKSISMNRYGKPATGIFISNIPAQLRVLPLWQECSVYQKLCRVLWIPVEAKQAGKAFATLRIGTPVLWSPSSVVMTALQRDWEELMRQICLGSWDMSNKQQGEHLYIRTHTRNHRKSHSSIRVDGKVKFTLAFYLRARFVARHVFGQADKTVKKSSITNISNP